MTQIPKRIIPNSEVKKWLDVGWAFSATAVAKGHSILVWLGDDKPREPAS
jgi:hypothetical protein